MDTLLVLGLIPGTNFQITFTLWLQCLEALILAAMLTKLGLSYIKASSNDLHEVSTTFKALAIITRHR